MLTPNVFISSRLRLNKIRQQLKETLEHCGFAVDIYEDKLTPSVEPATYLGDIRDSDFVIFILDEHYGTPRTKTGRSGTHEEWNIAWRYGIPSHVFLKRTNSKKLIDPRQKRFITSELQAREISYQFFTSTTDLKAKVERSIAKMAIAIARSDRFRLRAARETLIADVVEYEYKNFLELHQLIQQASAIDEAVSSASRISNAWGLIFDSISQFDPSSAYPFYDSHLQAIFGHFITALHRLSEYEGNSNNPEPAAIRSGPALRMKGAEIAVSTLPVHPNVRDFWNRKERLMRNVTKAWERVRILVNLRHDRYTRAV